MCVVFADGASHSSDSVLELAVQINEDHNDFNQKAVPTPLYTHRLPMTIDVINFFSSSYCIHSSSGNVKYEIKPVMP